jgi:hypothetical protein
MLSFLLELIKLTIPGLMVFLATYFVLKSYMENQQRIEQAKSRNAQLKTTIPLKLQAYERLSLLCERIAIPNLILRVRKEGMTASDLKLALMFAIQHEYEHNITQQVYVSQQLWEIIKITRDESVELVNLVAKDLDKDADGRELAMTLLNLVAQREASAGDKALIAIKKEASTMF